MHGAKVDCSQENGRNLVSGKIKEPDLARDFADIPQDSLHRAQVVPPE
jgi:hypothetical protein